MPDYTFGSILTRLFLGGARLSKAEKIILFELIKGLPEHLQGTVVSQFKAYNLVQREVDGRALNFYRLWPVPIIAIRRPIPSLPAISTEEAVLIKGKFKNPDSGQAVHANMHAVGTRAFCISLDRAVDQDSDLELVSTKNSWRSNYSVGAQS